MLLLNPVCPWNGGPLKQDVPPGDSIAGVYTPGTHVNRAYTEYLEIFGDGIKRFQQDDIPVIIRLFGENNGNWFWFHHGNEQVSAEAFQALYAYTVDYLRDTLGLHNLLFCYEVSDHLYGGSGKRAWYTDGLVPDKTDILGIQCYYNFNPGMVAKTLDLYRIYDSIGKPILMPQYIRDSENADIDWVSFLDVIKQYNPNIVGFSPWADGPGATKVGSLAANLNAGEFMKDPWTVNRGEVSAFPPREFMPLNIPMDESEGTRLMMQGRTVYNFQGGREGFTAGRFQGIPVIADTNLTARNNKLDCYYYIYPEVLEAGESAHICSPFDHDNPLRHSMVARENCIMKIRLRNHSTSETMKILWQDALTGSWIPQNSEKFIVERNGLEFREYTVDLSRNPGWNDTILRFRLYLATGSVIGSTEIDYIAFGSRADFGMALYEGGQRRKDIHVFPNPSNGWLKVEGLYPGDPYEIYSRNGQKLRTGKLDKNSILSLSGFTPGLYLLRFTDYPGKVIPFNIIQ
jgi:hypothetical protein